MAFTLLSLISVNIHLTTGSRATVLSATPEQ